MNKVLLGMLIACCAACLIGFWYVGAGLQASAGMVVSARKWVSAELPPVLKTWDAEELLRQAAPQMAESNPKSAVERTFLQLQARLGKLKALGEIKQNGFAGSSKEIVVSFKCAATFEKRGATVQVKVVGTKGRFQWANFFVED